MGKKDEERISLCWCISEAEPGRLDWTRRSRRVLGIRNESAYRHQWKWSLQKFGKKHSSPESHIPHSLCSVMKVIAMKTSPKMCGWSACSLITYHCKHGQCKYLRSFLSFEVFNLPVGPHHILTGVASPYSFPCSVLSNKCTKLNLGKVKNVRIKVVTNQHLSHVLYVSL